MTLSTRRSVPCVFALLATLATLSGCDKPATPAVPAQPKATALAAAPGIAWREGDIDAAFDQAKQSGKPLLLYWGAVWCHPCNVLKATVFKDPAFIASTQQFIAVHLDGDLEEAHIWGDRFGIRGYPTIILLRPDRSEITRLSGIDSSAHLVAALSAAAKSTGSAKQLLDKALHTPRELTAEDWEVLSNYDWFVDAQMVKDKDKAKVLTQLSEAAPSPALQHRFALLTLHFAKNPTPGEPVYRGLLDALLTDPTELHRNLGTVNEIADRLVMAVSSDTAERSRSSKALLQALDKAYADPTLPLLDRLDTVYSHIALARLAQGQPAEGKPDSPPLPKEVVELVHRRVQWATDQPVSDEERLVVIDNATSILGEIQDHSGAEQLLLAELPRSKTPSHYMFDLAELAERRGDPKTTLSWYRKKYESAQGEIARLQAAVPYIEALIRLRPGDAADIEAAAGQVIDVVNAQPDSYRKRYRADFTEFGKKLKAWSEQHRPEGGAVLTRLQQKARSGCKDMQPSDCASWLS
ncbi:thioredoxin family protein [Xanthomonas melonis]|uniref:Thioredoxin family protein n=1 Tax=Xanthomonas melonis TaxID=56456 RepID=A0ABS8NSU3_9XANT|nr:MULTISPECIES: thioredoxin family protein [Xanthomonas]MCC4585855.1 thioredoxin family protein [Xanthomonas sp. NCPPB 1067]MCD0257926.1 thioredoxin family protein [Xanthomonas melonis]MCD0266145.1 thioredoxin family protein [Xanthomonas melonis]